MRKPRRPWGSEGQEDAGPVSWHRGPDETCPLAGQGSYESASDALRGTKSYWKHLGWGFPTGFSIWPGFQAIKLHWNICSLTDCCFNNKPMFVLLSSSKKKTLYGGRGLFPGTSVAKLWRDRGGGEKQRPYPACNERNHPCEGDREPDSTRLARGSVKS